MLIVVIDKIQDKEAKIISKDIICPQCGESIFMNIKDYKINLYDCKNRHKINNLTFSEFKKTQYIDLSKIVCNLCQRTKNNTFNNAFYRCLTCDINLCPLDKVRHDEKHIIINYDDKNYICDKHNEIYIKYCSQCKLNLCLLCEEIHKGHNGIFYSKVMNYKENLLNEMIEFKTICDNLNKFINEITDKFNDFIYKIDKYKELANKIINNHVRRKRNYQALLNLKEIL